MGLQDALLVMVVVATRLENEGARIIRAGVDSTTGPHIQLWRVPTAIRELGKFREVRGPYQEIGYRESGVDVFWLRKRS